MAGARLIPVRAQGPSGWLAVILAVCVFSLCLGQRLGLSSACAQARPTAVSAKPAPSDQMPDARIGTFAVTGKTAAPGQDDNSCSLSEHLLSQIWHPLDPLFVAMLLLFALWLASPPGRWFARRTVPPLLFPGKRRHLVLCVFRE